MAAVLGIDSSTQSTKVEIRDVASGELLGQGRSPHPSTTPPRSEQDPRAWWYALVEALKEVRPLLGDVVGVSVAGQQHGLVMLDGEGTPLRPAKLWNDTESAPQAAALINTHGSSWWAETMGVVPVASMTLTKLMWVRDNEPQLVDRVSHIMLPHDYLTYRISGAAVTDRGDASGTAWWSPISGNYESEAVAAAELPAELLETMPAVLEPTSAAGTVAAPDLIELGIGSEAIVAPGTGDNMAGALGIGLGPGDVAVSIGTSGTAYAVSSQPVSDPTGLVAGFADATGRYLPLIATLNAVKITNWMAATLGRDIAALAELSMEAEPGSGGVVVVPYFDGERTPNLPDATGSITGLRTATSPAQLARATHEGVVCSLLEGVDAIRNAGVTIDGRLLVVGGGARSSAYREVIADLSELPVTVPDADEAVATGACVQAAATVRGEDPLAIAAAWGLGTGGNLPAGGDGAGVRERFRAARDQQWGRS